MRLLKENVMSTILRPLSVAQMNQKSREVVAKIATLPPGPMKGPQTSAIGKTVQEYLREVWSSEKPTHACGCGWKGNVSGDAGGCPACGGVVTPQT
ncbi:MAG: hypothetical protein KBE09_04000 [Candidatus Pacebacteria bacterium]|nr:hypothetical protein [Candidatus Paceibacterota bacterium]